MSYEAWIMISGLALSNLFILVGGLIHLAIRLTRIETDVKWIKRNCPQCPQTLENPLK